MNHSVCANLPNAGVVEEDDEVAGGDPAREPGDDERHRERRDQRVDLQHRRHEPVHEPDGGAREDAARDRKPGVVMLRDLGGGHPGQRVDRANREVDPAGDEHERPGRRNDQRRRLLVEDVEHVHLREEGSARQRQDRRTGRRTGSGSRGCAAGRSRSASRPRPLSRQRSFSRSRRTRPRGSRPRSARRPRARRRCGRGA